MCSRSLAYDSRRAVPVLVRGRVRFEVGFSSVLPPDSRALWPPRLPSPLPSPSSVLLILVQAYLSLNFPPKVGDFFPTTVFFFRYLKINIINIQRDSAMGSVDGDSCICLLHRQMLKPSLSIPELYPRHDSRFYF